MKQKHTPDYVAQNKLGGVVKLFGCWLELSKSMVMTKNTWEKNNFLEKMTIFYKFFTMSIETMVASMGG